MIQTITPHLAVNKFKVRAMLLQSMNHNLGVKIYIKFSRERIYSLQKKTTTTYGLMVMKASSINTAVYAQKVSMVEIIYLDVHMYIFDTSYFPSYLKKQKKNNS